MAFYRMAVDAGVFFSVEADTEEQAVEKAKAVRDQLRDGLPVDAGEDGLDMRVYTGGREVPLVQDIEDDEDALNADDEA